ncbi:MAG: ParB N-terminal domain-containing protein [bacterium]
MKSASETIEPLAIESITVGKRRRQKLGNVRALAKSIGERGLLHPIIVRNGNELVAGERRLEACRRLGWQTILARHFETLSNEELRAIELDENTQRLDLNDLEASKIRLAQIRQAEAELKAEKELRPESGRKSKPARGRPKEPGSKRDIEARTGISRSSQVEIEAHVSLAERYPFMQRNGWVQHQVLEAGAEIEKLSEAERGQVAAFLDQDAIPPKKSIEIIRNMAQMPAARRKEIVRLSESGIEHDRQTALTKAANLPPPPDPAINWLRQAESALNNAVRLCVTESFRESLRSLRDRTSEIEKEFTKYIRRSSNGESTPVDQ